MAETGSEPMGFDVVESLCLGGVGLSVADIIGTTLVSAANQGISPYEHYTIAGVAGLVLSGSILCARELKRNVDRRHTLQDASDLQAANGREDSIRRLNLG
jgi:hypothetical protein